MITRAEPFGWCAATPKQAPAEVKAWREATKTARIAEAKLADARDEFKNNGGPRVRQELLREVAELRDRENDLLTAVMQALRR